MWRWALGLLISGATLGAQGCASEAVRGYGGGTSGSGGSGGSTAMSGTGGSATSCEPEATCEAYCANVYQPRACTTPDGLGPCISYCQDEIESYLPGACLDAWHEFLSCMSCVEVSCDPGDCHADICGDAPFLLGCDGLADLARDCAGPCLRDGLESGPLPGGSFVVKSARCECPASLEPGAAEGGDCTLASDCAEVCCGCPGGSGVYVARACHEGVCLAGSALCELGETALFVDVFCNG